MDIRSFQEKDLQACVETFITIFSAEPWCDEWTTERATAYIQQFISTPGFYGVLAIEEEVVIGLALGNKKIWWQGDELFIHEFGVHPQFEGRGIAKALLQHLEQYVRAEQLSAITLSTQYDVPAFEFYLHNGFRASEKTRFLFKNIK